MSPVSVSPPRRDIPEPSFAQVRTASPRSNLDSRRSSRNVQTPDSGGMEDSVSSLPIRTSRPASGGVKFVQERPGSRASSSSMPRIEDFGGELHPPEEEAVGLQYLAFDDAPRKRKEKRASHVTVQSGSSSGGSDHRSSQLHVPGTALARPTSTYTLGSDLRGRTLSPLSANGSDPGSPASYARDLSSSRRSPNSRPVSYIDLLQNIPYSQQVAPGHNNNNQDLQNVVGNAASLLNTKKTLEMYRANVKKTKDPAIQYEFAIFMVNAARDEMLNQEPDSNPAELIKEAKHILQGLSDRAYPFAQYYLGDGYFSGLFNKDRPDWNSAFPLFVAASKHGHAEAGYRAALCYEFGWGTSKSYPKAIQFYRNAASKNHPGAATRLGMACLKGDMGLGKDRAKEGFKWLKRAQESADLQYNEAPFELGVLHLTGHGDDIFKDEAYAAQLLTQAAELGHAKANFLMGQAYENGQMGCPRDPALSVHFYNGAATRGVPEAMMALCAWYMVGAAPVLEKDEVEACEWAKKAAECGSFSLCMTILYVAYHTDCDGMQVSPKPSTPWAISWKWALAAAATRSKPMCGTSARPTAAMRMRNTGLPSFARRSRALRSRACR